MENYNRFSMVELKCSCSWEESEHTHRECRVRPWGAQLLIQCIQSGWSREQATAQPQVGDQIETSLASISPAGYAGIDASKPSPTCPIG